MRYGKIIIVLILGLMATGCHREIDIQFDPDSGSRAFDPLWHVILPEKKEIRAAWIATVSNLDWPTTKNNPDAQKSELLSLYSTFKSLNFNAVIFQVRPNADSFYPSALEPWSVYLTGEQGKDPGYDPLKFAVEEAHRMGMEFHAWLNPYRIGSTSLTLSPNHVAVRNPSWVVTFNHKRYFNPGLPEVRAHLVAVVKDIVSRYDVDAIHFDDYFYPTGIKSSNPFVFDDQEAFIKYGNGMDITAWRNKNVNTMVNEVFNVVRTTRSGVLFGISPSGRRENSLDLYADPLVWLNNKWLDYLAPQLYWEFGHKTADFGRQAAYWTSNSGGIPIVFGMAAYKYKDSQFPSFGNLAEFDRQIEEARKSSNTLGSFFFRAKFLQKDELFKFLSTKYISNSLIPPLGLLSAPPVTAPGLSVSGTRISWDAVTGAEKYAVYILENDGLKNNGYIAKAVHITSEKEFTGINGNHYYVTAVNRDNLESSGSGVVFLK